MSFPGGDITSIKRSSENDGGSSLIAPIKRMSSLTPIMFLGTSARGIAGLQLQPDHSRWSTVDEDEFDASGNFSIGGAGDFQANENENHERKETGASFEIPERNPIESSSPSRDDASFAPPFDPQESDSTGFDSSLGPDIFDAVPPPPLGLLVESPPTLAFESSLEGAVFADFDLSAVNRSGAHKATEKPRVAADTAAAEFEQPPSSQPLDDLPEESSVRPAFASYEHSNAQLFSRSEGPELFFQFDPNSSKAQVFTMADISNHATTSRY
jgi:hypothetical protein